MTKLLKTLALAAASTVALTGAALAEVRTERVTFQSGGETLVGTLYLPEGASAQSPAPAVVVTGAWMTVRQQMAGLYARELAERGFVALAFDFRGWGESGGALRSMEDPAMKTQDIVAAARFLDARAETGAVGGIGICASSGYMIDAAVSAPGVIRSVAVVAPWLHDAEIVDAVYGGAASVAGLIAIAEEAQARFAATGEQTLVPAAGPAGSNAVMAGVPYYTEADRGLIPEWENTFNLASWNDWLTYDAHANAAALSQPFFLVHSEAAAIPQGAHRFYAAAPGRRGQLWLEGVSQLDFYDRPAPVAQAADAVAAHFRLTL